MKSARPPYPVRRLRDRLYARREGQFRAAGSLSIREHSLARERRVAIEEAVLGEIATGRTPALSRSLSRSLARYPGAASCILSRASEHLGDDEPDDPGEPAGVSNGEHRSGNRGENRGASLVNMRPVATLPPGMRAALARIFPGADGAGGGPVGDDALPGVSVSARVAESPYSYVVPTSDVSSRQPSTVRDGGDEIGHGTARETPTTPTIPKTPNAKKAQRTPKARQGNVAGEGTRAVAGTTPATRRGRDAPRDAPRAERTRGHPARPPGEQPGRQ